MIHLHGKCTTLGLKFGFIRGGRTGEFQYMFVTLEGSQQHPRTTVFTRILVRLCHVLFSVRYELNNMQIYVLVRPSLKDTSSTNSSTPRTLVVASTNSRALFSHVRYEPTIYKRQPDTVFSIPLLREGGRVI